MTYPRDSRRHNAAKDDQRNNFQRDRDRILYSSAFKRLAGVTQIVRAGEADVFHTRLTHSLKVAQLGRRIAQLRQAQQSSLCAELGVDEEVVEAACLAHDLGHPPFGHAGEHVLNELVEKYGDPDGFEGNAQTFRIITKLSVRFSHCEGLDLTRATLAACLKYPWIRKRSDPSRRKKWSVYRSEKDDFKFAWSGQKHQVKTAEAELMDWADDIAYSVHDLEDFHRCGAIPWHQIFSDEGQEQLIKRAKSAWWQPKPDTEGQLRKSLRSIISLFELAIPGLLVPYVGTRDQRIQIRVLTSQLIGKYLKDITLRRPTKANPKSVEISETAKTEIQLLKQITRDYIFSNPALIAQQKGQSKIIRELFQEIYEEVKGKKKSLLPQRFRHLLDDNTVSSARITADCISSLTEAEAVALHARLNGYSGGSVLDPIVR